MKRVLIHGYYGFHNAGDEAILTVLVARLRKLQPDLQIEVVSADPEYTRARHGIGTVSGYDPRGLLAAAGRCDFIIMGGGGLFHDYWGFDPDAVMTDRAGGMGYYANAAVLAAIFGKPLLLYAVGAGPLDSVLGREYMRFMVHAASMISVRDEGSREMFASMGVPFEKIIVTADPAFDLKEFTTIAAPRGSVPLVGVSLRRWSERISQPFWEREIALALDNFRKRQEVEFVFLPFDTEPGELDPDYKVLERVRDRMEFRDAVTLTAPDIDFMEVRGWIERCSLVVGMRLHSLIFAATLGVPFTGIVYDPKLPGVFDIEPFNSCLIGLHRLDASSLVSKMQEVYDHRGELMADLGLFIRAQRHASIQMAAALRPYLEGAGVPAGVDAVLGRFTQSTIEEVLTAQEENRAARAESQRILRTAEQEAAGTQAALRFLLDAAHQKANAERSAAQRECEALSAALASAAAEAAGHRTQLEAAAEREESLRRQVRSLQEKSAQALAKRQLQLSLDAAELVVPSAIRNASRGWYLNNVYYRIYPEARPTAAQPLAHSQHPGLLTLKADLRKGLSLGYEMAAHTRDPLVSVILPVFDGEPYLSSSIESVLNQSYRNLELIIVDDGSTDAGPKTMRRYESDPRVRVLRQSNKLLPAALNAGFQMARGQLWTWTSADNLMAPHCIATLADFLQRRPDVELVYANQMLIGEEGEPLNGTPYNPQFQTPPGSANIHWPDDPGGFGFGTHNYLGACWLYRDWAGRLLGPHLDAAFGFEDFEYWMRMNVFFRMAHLDRADVLYSYRLHPNSLSSQSAQLNLEHRVVHFVETIEPDRHRAYREPCRFALIGESRYWAELREALERSGHSVTRELSPDVSCALFASGSVAASLKRETEQAGIACRAAIVRDVPLDDDARWLTFVLCESDSVCQNLQARGFYRSIRWRETRSMVFLLLSLVRNERGIRIAQERTLRTP
jgi:polysaccharide pyruvyl transferase CsaB